MRLAAVIATLALAAPAAAAEPRATLPDVEDEVMCVTCKVPLNVADSPQATRQRDQIRRYVDRGLTKRQIKARLVEQYGEDVLAVPEDDGFGLTAYVVPPLLALLALAALLFTAKRWRRQPRAAGPAADAPLEDEEASRLEKDMAAYEL